MTVDVERSRKERDAAKKDFNQEPGSLHVKFDGIPEELKGRRQWVTWKYTFKSDRAEWAKIPHSPLSGKYASSTDPGTWGEYEDAKLAYEQGSYSGVGFVFSKDDEYAGVDLDSCRDEQGNLSEEATRILERFDTYAEVSPSGSGVKLLVKGNVAQAIGKSGTKHGDYEAYSAGRYFTLTGHSLEAKPIAEGQENLAWFIENHIPQDKKPISPNPALFVISSDDDVWQAMKRSKNWADIERLYVHGDLSAYNDDESSADLALANILAFFYGPNQARIEQAFSRSALGQRDKWKNRPDYRQRTIAKALDGKSEFYGQLRGSANQAIASDARPAFITNYRIEEDGTKGGRPRVRRIGLCGDEIKSQILQATGGWPKRANGYLFAPDGHSPLYLPETADVFAWLNGAVTVKDGLNPTHWATGDDKITQSQMQAYLLQQVERFDCVEAFPHYPLLPRHHYLHPELPVSTGEHLLQFLNFFCPATTVDADLILAYVLTLVVGCNPGQRPAFLFTGEDGDGGAGRGVGKTTIVKLCSKLVGGYMSHAPQESGGDLKKRLLSPSGLLYRVVNIDNIKSAKFSCADVEALITEETISGHAMYIGEGRRPNHLIWCLTVNGACLSKDLANRCIIIKLKRPSYQGNWENDVSQFVEKYRWRILADIIAVLKSPSAPMSIDTRWATWEKQVLSKVNDPAACKVMIAERQSDVDGDSEEMELVRNEFIEQIRNTCHDPDTEALNIPSKMTAAWYGNATGQPFILPQKATTMIKALAIPELTPFRSGTKRGLRGGGVIVLRGTLPRTCRNDASDAHDATFPLYSLQDREIK